MKKLLLSFFALSMAILTWANPSGNYHVAKALIHYVSSSYKFANGEEWALESGDDEYAWDVQITSDAEGACTIFNLIGNQESFTGTYDAETGVISIPAAQTYTVEDPEGDYEMAICGGISGYTEAQALMNYVDSYTSYVTKKILPVTLQFDQTANTISAASPILVYAPYDAYEGYVGYASYLFSELDLEAAQAQGVTISVNNPEGVRVTVDTEDDVIDVEFEDASAEISDAQYIRIYNVDPYIITSVTVNGEAFEAEQAGRFYFIEVTEETRSVVITVEEQEVVDMTMMVYVEGLAGFENLAILDKDGELGKAIASKDNFTEGVAVPVYFTNFDLPLQVYGTWENGSDYQMVVKIDGNSVPAVQEGPTSALFMEINVENEQTMSIQLMGYEPAESSTATYHVQKAVLHYESASYKFANGEEWAIESGDDEYAWDCDVTVDSEGNCTLFNLLGDEETLYGTCDEAGLIVLPVQSFIVPDSEEEYEMAICGGISGYTEAQALMDYVDQYGSYVTSKVLAVNLQYEQTNNTITLTTPILVYAPYDAYEGYVGYASYLFSELILGTAQDETALYLRGSMNNWETPEEYRFTRTINENGEVEFILSGVEFEPYTEFKLASEDWSEYNFGGYDWNSETIVSANEPIVLYESGSNLKADFYVTKDMVFTFNLNTQRLLIEGDSTPLPKEIYLRGGMNGWVAEEAYRFTTEDNIVYTLTGVTVEEGEEFKIADEYWYEVNAGALEGETVVSANQDFKTYDQGWNMTADFTITEQDVIEFNILTGILYIRTDVSAIQTVNADALQSKWYNLQGIEVNKAQLLPGNIYINNGKKVFVK